MNMAALRNSRYDHRVAMEMQAILIEDSGALLQLFEDKTRSFDMIFRGCLTFEPEPEQRKTVCHTPQIHNLMNSCYGHSGMLRAISTGWLSLARLPLLTLLGGNDFLLAPFKHRNRLHWSADRVAKDKEGAGNDTGLIGIVRKRLGVPISNMQPQRQRMQYTSRRRT